MNNITHQIFTPEHGRAPFRIFMAGSIDNGDADPWHSWVAESITHCMNRRFMETPNLEFYSPRREHWNKNSDLTELQSQIRWELDTMMKCDLVLIYFTPDSKSPITLLEFGLLLGMGKTINIYVPRQFYRWSNVVETFNMLNTNPQSFFATDDHVFITMVATTIKQMCNIPEVKVTPNVYK